eukprot:NODE_1002_length_1330_cov_47.949258_g828_i0.p1 GENE.NODE_1002_length_1330_cov_47.949258_g828_i0~~NODE_1002_length_1330_cov_47.949258_g828_i0.p1  ORF type:complete len:159 (+),score=26.98 NODE_1002_length_1330_cov_47.949258_g828_i0:827-1303(+)
MRGRSEIGPRGLGHRSILARPSAALRRRLYGALGMAEFQSPPTVVERRAACRLFQLCPESPYMSFTAQPEAGALERVPEIAHADGTVWLQTVAPKDDVWLHRLLTVFGRSSGLPILFNFPFRLPGRPLLNSVHEALQVLDSGAMCDALVVQDTLFCRE